MARRLVPAAAGPRYAGLDLITDPLHFSMMGGPALTPKQQVYFDTRGTLRGFSDSLSWETIGKQLS